MGFGSAHSRRLAPGCVFVVLLLQPVSEALNPFNFEVCFGTSSCDNKDNKYYTNNINTKYHKHGDNKHNVNNNDNNLL